MCWVPVSRLYGQEALTTAIQQGEAYQGRSSQVGRLPHEMSIGPVQFSAGLSYTMQWNDNIYLVPSNLESDLILNPMLKIGALWPATEESSMSFGMGIGYQHYLDHSDLNRLNIVPDSELAWDIHADDFTFSLFDSVSYTQDPISQGSLSGTASFPTVQNTAGLDVKWRPSRYSFTVGYAHFNLFSQSSQYDYLTRASEQFYGNAAYSFADRTKTGIEASGSLTRYESGFRPNYQSISCGPFLNWQLIDSLSLTLRGGYVIYLNDPSTLNLGADNVTSYYIDFRATHQLTDFISHGLTVVRDVQPGDNRGNLFQEQFQASYFAAWAFHRNFSFTASFFYELGSQPVLGIQDDYSRFGAGCGLTWQPLEKWNARLGYNYTEKTDTFSIQNYQQNVVSLGITYRF